MKIEQGHGSESLPPSSSPLLEDGITSLDDPYSPIVPTKSRPRGLAILKIIVALLGLFIVDLSLRAIYHLFIQPSSISSSHNSNEFIIRVGDCNCGQSVAEARARGCVYDGLSITWLPPECFDEELTNEFNHAGPGPDGAWPYFADKEGTVSLTLEETSLMADSGEGFWTSRGWHLSHCNYSWRKMYRAQKTGKMIHREKNDVHHIRHCGMLGGEEFVNVSLDTLDTNLRNSFAVH